MAAPTAATTDMSIPKHTRAAPTTTFSDRIKLLIQRVGSATEIARMCGFSEGVVRSWRDSHTDPSRARCVTMARTLGISLVWLVAGEGALQIDPGTNDVNDQYTSERASAHRPHRGLGTEHAQPSATTGMAMDAPRMHAAMQLMQSELSLAGSPLSLFENTDLLIQLYEALGPAGAQADAVAVLSFKQQLAARIERQRQVG